MVKCIILYNSQDNPNITLMNDNSVLVNCVENYKIDRFLCNTKVNSLYVIFKPTICNSVPDNGYKIGNVTISGILKSCVISDKDIQRLADYSSLYKVENFSVYNYLDLITDKYKSEEKILVVIDWAPKIVAIGYIEMGELVDFRRIKEDKLTNILSKLRNKYGCRVVQFSQSYDYVSCNSCIDNLDSVDSSKKIFLSHIPYVLENKGIPIVENRGTVIDIFGDRDSDDAVDDVYTEDIDSDLDNSNDIDDIERPRLRSNPIEKKPSFIDIIFGIFKKKAKEIKNAASDEIANEVYKADKDRKEGKFDFDNYVSEDIEEDDGDEDPFSHEAVRKNNSVLHSSYGLNPNARRHFRISDYIYYGIFIVFFSCTVIFGGLQFVYKEKLNILSGEYDSAVKMKNLMETNVSLANDASKAPSIKIAQLSDLTLPDSFEVRNVDYDGTQYKINLKTDIDDNIDTFREYLPDGLVVSGVNQLTSSSIDSKKSKIYEVILLVS